jgi:LmbE family N-acetylglucosaminyl deacetylase
LNRTLLIFFFFIILLIAFPHEIWGEEEGSIEPDCIFTPEGHTIQIATLSHVSRIEHRRWIVVYSPHPDDEILGLGATMHYYKRNGFDVLVVLLTHGEKSNARVKLCDQYNLCISETEFGLLRVNEFHYAMTSIGVYHVVYDYGDQAIREDSVQDIIQYYDRQLDIRIHFTTAPEKGHNRDHLILSQALRRCSVRGDKAEFAVYALYRPDVETGKGVTVIRASQDVAAKRDALYQYRYWNPARGRYSIGYLSCPELWNCLYSKCEYEIIYMILDEKPWQMTNPIFNHVTYTP